ncbi:hypothetical protein C8J57DRAFT_1493463 [Mycena rebaudengoi]|nr:hypothetical protein C8J57DRAFT_1493463 [Mycena rebaudengoi]
MARSSRHHHLRRAPISRCTRYFPAVTALPTTACSTESRVHLAYSMVAGCRFPLPHAFPNASTHKHEGEAVDPEEPTRPLLAHAPDTPPALDARIRRRYFSLIFRAPAVHARPPYPQSHRVILSQLSTRASKRSRAHDAVPLMTMLDSTAAALSSISSSAAADALCSHTPHSLQNRLSTM